MNALQRQGKHKLLGNSKPWIVYYNGIPKSLSKNEIASLEFKVFKKSTVHETHSQQVQLEGVQALSTQQYQLSQFQYIHQYLRTTNPEDQSNIESNSFFRRFKINGNQSAGNLVNLNESKSPQIIQIIEKMTQISRATYRLLELMLSIDPATARQEKTEAHSYITKVCFVYMADISKNAVYLTGIEQTYFFSKTGNARDYSPKNPVLNIRSLTAKKQRNLQMRQALTEAPSFNNSPRANHAASQITEIAKTQFYIQENNIFTHNESTTKILMQKGRNHYNSSRPSRQSSKEKLRNLTKISSLYSDFKTMANSYSAVSLKPKKKQKLTLSIEGAQFKNEMISAKSQSILHRGLKKDASPSTEGKYKLRALVEKISMLNDTFKFLRFEPILDRAIFFTQKTCFAGLCSLSNIQLTKSFSNLRMHFSASKRIISCAKQQEFSPFFNEAVRRVPKVLMKLLISYMNEQEQFDQYFSHLDQNYRRVLKKVKIKIKEKTNFLPVCFTCLLMMANIARAQIQADLAENGLRSMSKSRSNRNIKRAKSQPKLF